MTLRQKILAYVLGLGAAALLLWPTAPLLLFFFADMNGDIPTRYTDPR